MVKSLKKDKLAVNIYENRTLMGKAAADDIAACMEKLLSEKSTINMVFAAAPSQNDVLESLLKKPLDWNKVNAFHMDEYVGLKKEDPQSFGNYLNEHIFKKVPFANIYYVADYGLDYEKLLAENHIDNGKYQEKLHDLHFWLKILSSYYASSNTILLSAFMYALILAATISVDVPLPE